MQRFSQLRRLVLALSGADTEILEYVPSERTRFESLGWAILITSCMAMISMWFALSSALSVNGIIAIPVAVFWGFVIMGIDRWLITSMPIDGSRKFAMAVPRVLLAVLLGTLISTPLVLRIFQSEINAQMAVMQESSYGSFLDSPQSKQVNQQVTTYGNELNQLETVVNSKGVRTGNTAADPQLVRYNAELTQLQGQLNHWTSLKNTYYAQYNCQLYGGSACPKAGAGPVYKASHANYVQASAQVTSYTNQVAQVQNDIKQRNQELNSTSTASQQQRYEEAKQQLPLVQSEYTAVVQRRDQFQTAFYAQNQASHGILRRLEALSQLSDGNFTVTAARFLLFLLFLVIECLPVTVKLLQKPGEYEAALSASKKADRRDYEKFFSTRSRLRQVGFGAGGPGLGPFGQPQGEPGMPAGLEPQPEQIWNGTRRLPTVTDELEDIIPTEIYQDPEPRSRSRRGKNHGSPEDDNRRERRWHGEDNWRNNWVPQDQDEQAREDRYRGETADPRVAQTRRDSLVPPTRLDNGYQSDRPADSYQDDDSLDFTDSYREASLPALEAASDYGDESVQARADGNGGGVPLNWDDE
jgi:hypothetical protein